MSLLNFGTSNQKNTFVSQRCLTSFIQSDSFRLITKDLLSTYFPKCPNPRASLKKIVSTKTLFKPFNPTHPKHNQYASWIGKWSEFFLETLLEEDKLNPIDSLHWSFTDSKDKRTVLTLLESSCLIERLLGLSIKKTKFFFLHKCRTFQDNIALQFIEFSFDKPYPILNEDCDYFESVINHFKNNVFVNTKSFISRPLFVIDNKLKNNQQSEITGWEFDFYDLETNSIVELKFQQLGWSEMWLWQSLVYLYLVYFTYQIKGEGVKVLNTLTGVQYQLKLSDFCQGKNTDSFYEICKIHIMDQEKVTFRDNVVYLYKKYLIDKVLNEDMVSHVFKGLDSKTLMSLVGFLNKIFIPKNKDFIKNPSWLWAKRNAYLKSG